MAASMDNIPENLVTLRRRLKLSQTQLIETYLIDEHGTPLCSVATLSNIENGRYLGGKKIAEALAEKLQADVSVFSAEPDVFAKNIDLFFESALATIQLADDANQPSKSVETLVKTISDYFMDAITKGELAPGDKLPSDRDLGEMFGVGRAAVREALKVLSTLGILDILPSKGTFLTAKSSTFFMLPLSWSFFIGENTANNVLEVRNVLEAESARLAGERAGQEELAALEKIYSKMTDAIHQADFKTFLDSDLDFHLAIARCSCNPIIVSLLETSRNLLRYISKSGMVTVQHLEDIYREHGRIYAAVIAGHPEEAYAAMTEHLHSARNRYAQF